MSSGIDPLYNFVFRGQLAEQSLDLAGRSSRRLKDLEGLEMAKILSLDLLDDELVENARAMANVYIAVAAFENSVRQLISSVLLEKLGENWWASSVSEKIRTRAQQKIEEEEKNKWHVQRGSDPINYTQLNDLLNILRQNWPHFEPYIPTAEWATGIFDAIERSRNVIMHSGMLTKTDIERLGVYIRDSIKQVGV